MNFYEFSKILEENKLFRIPSRDPVRNAVASVESYWPKPGLALTHIQEILFRHGYIIPYASFNVHDRTEDYTQRFDIERRLSPEDPNSETEPTNSSLNFSWHWISQNQVEITAYLT